MAGRPKYRPIILRIEASANSDGKCDVLGEECPAGTGSD